VRYSYLQLLDLLTTVAFLLYGVREGNPVVRSAMQITGSPLAGVLIIKLMALGIGVFCWRTQRFRVLSRVNIFYAVVIAWNLCALLLAAL
ncbi:MAG: DUF5658 family protein, partial [Bryobacteraceae bacterium]